MYYIYLAEAPRKATLRSSTTFSAILKITLPQPNTIGTSGSAGAKEKNKDW